MAGIFLKIVEHVRDQLAALARKALELLERARLELEPLSRLLQVLLDGDPGMEAGGFLDRFVEIMSVHQVLELLANGLFDHEVLLHS